MLVPQEANGCSGQFAKVLLTVEPFHGGDGATYEFENKVTGGRIPRSTSRRWMPARRTHAVPACWPAIRW